MVRKQSWLAASCALALLFLVLLLPVSAGSPQAMWDALILPDDADVWRSLTAQDATASVSGRILTDIGAPLTGVLVDDGQGHSATTDFNGNYALLGLPAGMVTLTPSMIGYVFSPPSRQVVIPPDSSGQDFTAHELPPGPCVPQPADDTVDQPIALSLCWTLCSPDGVPLGPADLARWSSLLYDVYLGTSSGPSQVVSGVAGTCYTPTNLAEGTRYYWYVVARDASGRMSQGPVWEFTTVCPLPGIPADPTPLDGVADVLLDADLSWSVVPDAESYDVYWGPYPQPNWGGNTSSNSFVLPTLQQGTHYCWMVVARNHCGSTSGPVWTFTTCISPAVPADPAPINHTLLAALDSDLDWSDTTSATSYDVYWGTSPTPSLVGSISISAWNLPLLNPWTHYYWRIVAHNDCGLTAGPLWDFVTCGLPDASRNPSPVDRANAVAVSADLDWADLAGVAGYDVYFGLVTPPPFFGHTQASNFSLPILEYSARYYWEVAAINACGQNFGPVWSFTTTCALPDVPSNPLPASGATDVSRDADLDWDDVPGATLYQVYWGLYSQGPVYQNTTATSSFALSQLSPATHYCWRIVAVNDCGQTAGPLWDLTTCSLPDVPRSPWPDDMARYICSNVRLDWSDAAGAYSYTLCMGTSPTSLSACYTTTSSFYDVVLAYDTVYYWQVVAWNACGSSSELIWSFATSPFPGTPSGPFPIDHASDVPLDADLGWDSDAHTYGWYVYWGTTPSPSHYGMAWSNHLLLPDLEPNTHYYWQLSAWNGCDVAWGPVWEYTTCALPETPGAVGPANGETEVSIDRDLDWTDCAGGSSYDVYFGLSNPPSYYASAYFSDVALGPLDYNTRYYWQVVARNACGSSAGSVWEFTTCSLPSVPDDPLPLNHASDVTVTSNLDWADASGAINYDVYLGTGTAPSFVGTVVNSFFAPPGGLSLATHYYWKIVAHGYCGDNEGPLWDFTTCFVPATPASPAPVDGANHVPVDANLDWADAAGTRSYEVYWGTVSAPLVGNTAFSSYDLPPLDYETRYYWRIVAESECGRTSGPLWSFTTTCALPGSPSEPVPAVGATNVLVTPTLTWAAADGALSYDLYFGTTSNPPLKGNYPDNHYTPSQLSYGTHYYWKIETRNVCGTTVGPLWEFSTCTLPGVPAYTSPANHVQGLGLDTNLDWADAAGASVYDVYWSTSSTPAFWATTLISYADLPTLQHTTRYYWKIVARSDCGTTDGVVYDFTTCGIPDQPSRPSPADHAIGVALGTDLDWEDVIGATSYAVYWSSTNETPTLYGSSTTSWFVLPVLQASTQYKWKIVAKNACGETAGETWSFATCDNPTAPSNPRPVDGMGDVGLDTDLAWDGEADLTDQQISLDMAVAASYDVYLGTSSPPPFCGTTAIPAYVLPTLAPATHYYWQVVARNGCGTTPGPIWHFFTCQAPGPLNYVWPSRFAGGVPLDVGLDWSDSLGATSYEVFFGTTPNPPFQGTVIASFYEPAAPLLPATHYYWKIVARSACGTRPAQQGEVWEFTTCGYPGIPSGPTPVDGATNVAVRSDLSWAVAAGATSYEVYFGTQLTPPLLGNTSFSYYALPDLEYTTCYYWKIVAANACGEVPGPTWSFTTTCAPADKPANLTPATGATLVALDVTLDWVDAANATSYDVYLGTSPSLWPPAVNVTVSNYDPGALESNTRYYWKIVAQNGCSQTEGDIWTFTTCAMPGIPSGPWPAHHATDVLTRSLRLDWGDVPYAARYRVYLGTTSPPPFKETVTGSGYSLSDALANATRYYWKVEAENTCGIQASEVWEFTTCGVPAVPSIPLPANNVAGVTVTTNLDWADSAWATSYDVFFGTSATPSRYGNSQISQYDLPKLNYGTHYYWQIVARSACAAVTSTVWSFTTCVLPTMPSAATPANGTANVAITTTLDWADSTGATSYDVYLGKDWQPAFYAHTVTSTLTLSAPLDYATRYYWIVVAKNDCGSMAGPTWNLTTACAMPGVPEISAPLDGATGVPLTTTLTWTPVTATSSYEVRLGTDSQPPYLSSTSATSLTVQSLASATRYYWQIVARNQCGSILGAVNSFTTCIVPAVPGTPAPADAATEVALETHLAWAAVDGATSYDVYLGPSTNPPFYTNTLSNNLTLPTTLQSATRYTWRVVARNACGPRAGPLWSFSTCSVPGGPSNPLPAHNASGVTITADLSWACAIAATSYDVYWGVSSTPTLLLTTTTTCSALLPDQEYGAVYYWKVVARNACGQTAGTVWNYTTGRMTNKVLINELELGTPDWVEFYNPEGHAVDVTGWHLRVYRQDGTLAYTYLFPTCTLGSRTYAVLHEATGTDSGTDLYTQDSSVIPWSNDTAGAAALTDSAGQGVDFVRWGNSLVLPPTGTGWGGTNPTAPVVGATLGRDAESTDTDQGRDWTSQLPSSGAHNTGAVICYSLSATVSPVGAGSIEISPASNCLGGQYMADSVVTLTAHGAGGMRFDHWSGDASGSSATVTLIMERSQSVVAYFTSLRVYLPIIAKALPTPTPTLTPIPSATSAVTPTSTPTPTATSVGQQLIINPGFETNDVWVIPQTDWPAGYASAPSPVHSGARSMRLGIVNPAEQRLAYSSVQQTVTIPAGITQATLTFFYYPVSTQVDADRIYFVVLRDFDDTHLEQTVWMDYTSAWQQRTFNLLPYAGRTIRVHLGVKNDGLDGVTAVYLDDVTLTVR